MTSKIIMEKICGVCLKSKDILCEACSNKIAQGRIKKIEVSAQQALHDLKSTEHALADVELLEVMEVDGVVLLVVAEGKGRRLIGPGGKHAKKIADDLKRKVRIIEKGGDEKKTVQSVIAPVQLLGINIVYTPNGGEKLKVRIPSLKRLPMKKEEAEKTIFLLLNKQTEITEETTAYR